ncbi:endolytic transglycosylase MltG [Candidatus Kaiserbacteria bacterium]|nr:endolytic transglycosylase MltG [Candidatus Kaiserbacteria bacterium]
MNRTYLIKASTVALVAVMVAGVLFSFPKLLKISIQHEQKQAFAAMHEQFPVTVNPRDKSIVEDALVNAFLDGSNSPLQASAWNVGNIFAGVFAWVAMAVADAPVYRGIAAADGRFVNITPGMRKEQVASAFAKTLGWNAKQKKEFLTALPYSSLPLPEGSFSPGIYIVANGTKPLEAQAMVNDKFSENILSRYGTTTAQIVPLNQALTIASMIEREAGGPGDMRLISGIIWNRLFINMNLQIDATLQYAKANTSAANSWWPAPLPADRLRKSPYNTYLNKGLPPAPIASPSVASVLAALNPKNTSCMFYFHDSAGRFHCSDTYDQHVALLKKYYGRGK